MNIMIPYVLLVKYVVKKSRFNDLVMVKKTLNVIFAKSVMNQEMTEDWSKIMSIFNENVVENTTHCVKYVRHV